MIVASVVMLPKLNLDAFPDVTNVQVTINTAAEGLAAEEVEKLISYPVESAVYALPAVTEVRSVIAHWFVDCDCGICRRDGYLLRPSASV